MPDGVPPHADSAGVSQRRPCGLEASREAFPLPPPPRWGRPGHRGRFTGPTDVVLAKGSAGMASLRAGQGGFSTARRLPQPLGRASTNPLFKLFMFSVSLWLTEVREHSRPRCRSGAAITSGRGAMTSVRWGPQPVPPAWLGPERCLCMASRGVGQHLPGQSSPAWPILLPRCVWAHPTAWGTAVLVQRGACPTLGAIVSPWPQPPLVHRSRATRVVQCTLSTRDEQYA